MFRPVQKVVTEHRYDPLQAACGARKSKVGGQHCPEECVLGRVTQGPNGPATVRASLRRYSPEISRRTAGRCLWPDGLSSLAIHHRWRSFQERTVSRSLGPYDSCMEDIKRMSWTGETG